MNCWHCNAPLIWGSDCSYEEYGTEGDGIVSFLNCPNCPASVEVFLPLGEEETDQDEKGPEKKE